MLRTLVVSLRMALVTIVVTGIIYPLVVTGIGWAAFPKQAGGSLLKDRQGKVIGSSLIAQRFDSARYFHPRPSAGGYDGMASGSSNLGPTNRSLVESVSKRVDDLVRANPGANAGTIPVDMVTTSASGLDPDVSPDSAYLQAGRVAAARGLGARQVRDLVSRHVSPRDFGILGEPRVNVLELNLALDAMGGK